MVLVKNLPQELIDLVIDSLHDDKVALRSCSLVCRSFLPASRRNFFYSIELYKEKDYVLFVQLLSHSPHLARFVRALCLDCSTAIDGKRLWRDEFMILPETLGRVVNLGHLVLLGSTFDMFKWTDFPVPLQTSLLAILQYPRLKSVTLSGIKEFPNSGQIFSQFYGSPLKHLYLENVEVAAAINDDCRVGMVELDSLGYHAYRSSYYASFLDHLQKGNELFRIAAVRELHLTVLGSNAHLLTELFSSTPVVEVLNLHVRLMEDRDIQGDVGDILPVQPLDLRHCSRLTTARIYVLDSDVPTSDALNWLADTLKSIPIDTPLKQVRVYLEQVTRFELLSVRPSRNGECPWAVMDATLTLEREKSPISCRFCVDLPIHRGSEMYNLCSVEIRKNLPQLHARGSLGICEDWSE